MANCLTQSANEKILNHHRIAEDAKKDTRYLIPDRSSQLNHAPTLTFWQKRKTYVKDEVTTRTTCDWISTFLPVAKWIRTYDVKTNLIQDVIAGLTVGVMIIPQSMSYAKLAGLPVEYGLYSALIPVYAYSLFGSSRQLAVGPVALLSLMVSTGLTYVIDPMGELNASGGIENNPEVQARYNVMAIQAGFLMGVVYIIMGILRLGFVTIFLSHAVISGFTTGAAVIIGMSQVKYIFGYNVPNDKSLHKMLYNIFSGIEQFNYRTFLLGIGSVILLMSMKTVGKKYPKLKWIRAIGPLTVTAISLAFTWGFDLQDKGIPVVGYIPQGFPTFTANLWTPIPEIAQLFPLVMSMVVVGFMESIAIAKQLASKHKYELDSSTELIGLGFSNLFGSMFNAYPVTGSFSRSAVNNESGAKSGISGIVTATLVMVILLFLTKLFERLPLAVLASIVISGVLGLLDYPEAIHLFHVHKFDFAVWCISCLGTMFLGVEIGLTIAVGVSILLVIYESAYPHTATLGRLPGTTVYRNIKQYSAAERYHGIVMCRIDAPLYFANIQNVRDKLNKYEAAAEEPPKFMIVDLSPVSHIDTSAMHIIADMVQQYESRGIQLCLCNPNRVVMDKLELGGLTKKIGEKYIFVRTHDAVLSCLQEMELGDADSKNTDVEKGMNSDTTPQDDIELIVPPRDLVVVDE